MNIYFKRCFKFINFEVIYEHIFFAGFLLLVYNISKLCYLIFIKINISTTWINQPFGFFHEPDCYANRKIYRDHDEHWSDTLDWFSVVRLANVSLCTCGRLN